MKIGLLLKKIQTELRNDTDRLAGGNAAQNPARLQTRRTQLATTLSIIASIADSSQYDDIMTRSTSIQWIWNLIETDYDIQKKGRHFLKLDKITFNRAGSESYMAFYKRLRAHFTDNLRKSGEIVKSKNDQRLGEDEKISPTLENTIVYMALKSIDQRLPQYVEQIYGHRMDENTTLFDVQSEIFQAIPKLITELDSKDPSLSNIDCADQGAASYEYQQEQHQDPTISAFNQGFPRFLYRPRGPARGGFVYRPRLAMQRPFMPRVQSTAPATYRPRQPGAGYVAKFCSLCRDARMPPRVWQSHNLSECGRLNRTTVTQLRSLVLEENIKPEEYPEYQDAAGEEGAQTYGYEDAAYQYENQPE